MNLPDLLKLFRPAPVPAPAPKTEVRSHGGWTELNAPFHVTAGTHITEQSAFRIPAVSQAIQLISSELATLPTIVMREGEFDEPAPKHPAYNLWRWNPNQYYTAARFKQTLGVHLCLSGNAFAAIERDSMGRPRALWPLEPTRVSVLHDDSHRFDERVIAYRYYGGRTNGSVMLMSSDVLHFRWMDSRTGLVGQSPVLRCAQALGLAQSTLDYSTAFFENGSHLSGVLEAPGSLSNEAFKNLQSAWRDAHSGKDSTFSTAILEAGLTWKPTSVKPVDGQLVEMSQENVNAVARIFNVPPFKIGGTSDSLTYSTELGATRDFMAQTIRPHTTEWSQEIRLKMLGRGFKAEFDFSDALRPDMGARYDAHAVALGAGWLTKNEVRAMEDMAPLPEMDLPDPVADLPVPDPEGDPEEGARSLGPLAPILEDAVSRVISRQRKALDGLSPDRRAEFFKRQPDSWVRALAPLADALEERGVCVDLNEVGTRLAAKHAGQMDIDPDLSLLWEPGEIAKEIVEA